MIAPPDRTVQPLRPEGSFGIQITVSIDGGYKTLWLSGISTPTADIFRTPQDLHLGIPIGQMINSLLQGTPLASELPEVVKSARVDRLELKKPAGQSNFSFGLEISVAYGESEVRLWLILEKATVNNKATYGFALKIRLGDLYNPSIELDIELDENGFFAHLEQLHNPQSFNLAPLGRVLSPELEELMGAIEITPRELAIGSFKSSDNSKNPPNSNQPNQKNTRSYVLAFRLQGEMTLSQLPFIGEKLPKDANVGIRDLSLVWCSAAIAQDEAAKTYFKSKAPSLITEEILSSSGVFKATLQVPSGTEQLTLPFAPPPKAPLPPVKPVEIRADSGSGSRPVPPQATPQQLQNPPGNPPAAGKSNTAVSVSTGTASDDSAKWFDVGKTVGPLSLKRMGLKYQDKKVWFLFDASLSAGAITLIVDGLGAGIDPFELLGGRFKPAFTLRGLGLIIKGPAEVSGAFLRERISDPRGDYDEFSGIVLIKTEALTVAGMGTYADPPWGDPSFFAYAFLDKTIGGPPFFFVTGLAIGIAVNRNLDLPPIDQVSRFPLVRLALGEPPTPPSTTLPAVRNTGGDTELAKLLQVQQAMKPYTRPNSGQVVLAIGVRFTTFQLLNSFALLVASFGKPFKLDLLISSRLQVPALPPGSQTSPAPIAQIGIDLRGTWIPEEGFLIIEGRITEGSWFLDSACRLSGGAAFASWTKGPYNGDFVMTVGGYHPKFSVPSHYPKVPRLALNLTRGPLEIKGEAYFAMTPAALMAGGTLNMTFTQGRIQVWFNCAADFLIAWEPFRYEATMQVEVGASYRTDIGMIRASIGARLQLWGPNLSGIATVDLKVLKYDVTFGDPKTPVAAIDAQTFRQRFLPASNDDLISIGVSHGLVRSGTHDGDPLFVVNPADFTLEIESVIPEPDGQTIGIGPMGRTALSAARVLTVKIDEDSKFKQEAIIKPVPSALWAPAPREGEVRSPSFNTDNTVINAIVGYTIRPNEYALIVKTNPNEFPETGHLSVFIARQQLDKGKNYYAYVFDQAGRRIFPESELRSDSKFTPNDDLKKQLDDVCEEPSLFDSDNKAKTKFIEKIRSALKLSPPATDYKTEIFLTTSSTWGDTDGPDHKRSNPTYPISNQSFIETDPLENVALNLYRQKTSIPPTGNNALFVAKEEKFYYATVFDKAGNKIFPDEKDGSSENGKFLPDTTLQQELDAALNNQTSDDFHKKELIQKIRTALGLTSVEIILKDVLRDPPEELLVALTGAANHVFDSEVPLSTDWSADLQELPCVVTLESTS